MMKIKYNKILIISIIFLILNVFISTFSNAALTGTCGRITDNTIFSSEYSFTPKFIKNVTTTQSYGMTNKPEDFLRTDGYTMTSDKFYSARLTSNTQKGKIWVRYNNVGTYKGKIIDLKITLSGWNYLQPANLSASSSIGGVSYPTVTFRKDSIDVSTTSYPAIDSPIWTFTFYINGTENTISIKSHVTFKDFDGSSTGANEVLFFKDGFESAYISKQSYLTLTPTNCTNRNTTTNSDTDKNAWVDCLNSGSRFQFIYTRFSDMKGNETRDITKTASGTTRSFFHYLIGAESIAPFEFTTPQKKYDKNPLHGVDEATYTISQFIPGESDKYYYTSYIVEDKIADCFNIESIKITDDSKTDKTSWFDITKSNNLAKISAKAASLKYSSFYNNNFYFNIKISKKADKFLSSFYKSNSNSCIVNNSASIKISGPVINGTRSKTLNTNIVSLTLNKEFELPKAGKYGDEIFIFPGILFVAISVIIKMEKKHEN